MIILQPDPRVALFAARFPSRSEPGRTHDAHLDPDGRWGCDCWHGLDGKECDHIRLARRAWLETRGAR